MDNDFCTKIIFRTEISVSLCHRLRRSASSCITWEGLRALDIHKESSLCVQSSVFSAAGARGIKLWMLLWSWWVHWVALGGKRPNGVLGLMIHDAFMPCWVASVVSADNKYVFDFWYKEDVKVMSRKHLSSYNKPSFLLLHFTLINGMFGCSGDRLVVLSYWCLIGLLILRPRWCLRRFFMFSKQLQNGISGV